ncbi:MAG: class I SAM-dependent methyltransferase [Candidatus Saliniplasma sp.]
MKRSMPADMKEIYALRADTIDYFFPDRDDEIDIWADIASDYGDEILHIMCGTGELTVGLAKKDFDITGLDFTESMIYQAKERIQEEGLEDLKIVQDDARHFSLNKRYDFVFVSTGDFHHFTERNEIDSFLAKAYAHLKPGGALGIELYVPPKEDFKNLGRTYGPLRKTPEAITVWRRNQISYHAEKKILEIMEEFHYDNNGDVKEGEYDILLRLFPKIEIETILRDAGFEDIKHLDGSNFSPYLPDEYSKTWIIIAEKH